MSKKKRAKERTYSGYRIMQKDFEGNVHSNYCVVRVLDGDRDEALNPRLDIANKSPSGFEWGYAGSGPAQLALALIADACGDEYAIPPIFQKFKSHFVAALPNDGWQMTISEVRNRVQAICAEIDIYPALPVDEGETE